MAQNGSTFDFSSLFNYGANPNQPAFDFSGSGSGSGSGFTIPNYGSNYQTNPVSTIDAAPMTAMLSMQQAPDGPIGGGRTYVPSASAPFGFNLDTAKTGMGVLQTGANIWSAFQQASLAKQQLAYAKEMGAANLANQMKSYNTTLGSQANMDAKVGGWSPEQTAAYLAANKLTGK